MKTRILVVDDDEAIRVTFNEFLTKEGHEVVLANDYPSAREEINTNNFDLVFADIMLDNHSGIDILREIREKGLRSPVIMITGKPDIENAAQSVRLGAFDYLCKPVLFETVISATMRALNHKSLLDEKIAIQVENERYRYNLDAIFRSVEDGIVTVDPQMRVIEVNEAIKSICGIQREKIKGRFFNSTSSQCRQFCHHVLKKTLKSKKSVKEYRIECNHSQKPEQVAVLNSSPLLDSHNQFQGAILVIRDITRLSKLEQELQQRHQFHNIIGKSNKMQELFNIIENLTETETTVLITGESGTGKELVAKALHYNGTRAFGPYIKVNCSALAENLLESELFGHVKGAFTGAIKDKQGRFMAANGGTILLDEIGEMNPKLQLKLLRVLQEKEFECVGDSRPIKVDVRVIAATNSNLREKMRSGQFREDLYYRLKVVELHLPPLRERHDDIPLFCKHFLDMYNKIYNKNISGVSNQVMQTLMEYHWPGNVRELEHAIEHAFVLCNNQIITMEHLPIEINKNLQRTKPPLYNITTKAPQNILNALEQTDWNKAKAARLLGLSRQTIYRKIKEYKLTTNTM